MIDLSGEWESKDNVSPAIKSDNGYYVLTQAENVVFVKGVRDGHFKNIGYAEFDEIEKGSELIFIWTDTMDSPNESLRKTDHKVKVRIVDSNTIDIIEILVGEKNYAFGSLKKINRE